MKKMLQKDPESRPDINKLLKEPILIESIQKLFEIIDGSDSFKVFKKSIAV